MQSIPLSTDGDTAALAVLRRASVGATHHFNPGRSAAVDVDEQNTQAVGAYQRMGFAVSGRSSVDDAGRPYPLLHMRQPDAARQ